MLLFVCMTNEVVIFSNFLYFLKKSFPSRIRASQGNSSIVTGGPYWKEKASRKGCLLGYIMQLAVAIPLLAVVEDLDVAEQVLGLA